MKELVVRDLRHTQDGPPIIWEGTLEDGTPVNFRYRWGMWSINTGDVSIFSSNRKTIACGSSGRGDYDGHCTWDELVEWMKKGHVSVSVSFAE